MTTSQSCQDIRNRIFENLKVRPRPDEALIPDLELVVESFPEEFRFIIELADSLLIVGRNQSALEFAKRAVLIQPKNIRALSVLSRSFHATGHVREALRVTLDILICLDLGVRNATCDSVNELVFGIILALSNSSKAWKLSTAMLQQTRDLMALARDSGQVDTAKVSLILAPNDAPVREIVRWLQLQATAIGSGRILGTWLHEKLDSLSEGDIWTVYLLLGHHGNFPERFKAFCPEFVEYARIPLEALSRSVLRPRSLVGQPHCRKRLLFVLASMPCTPLFIATGAHFKVVADYAHFLTSLDANIEVCILLTNELSEASGASHYALWPPCLDSGIYEDGVRLHHPDAAMDRINFECSQQTPATSPSTYFSFITNRIVEINPLSIVWFGGVLESIAFPALIGEAFPSVYRQFNATNRPRGTFDVGLSYSSEIQKIVPGNWKRFEVAYSDLPTNSVVPESILSRIKDRPTVVTVGNNLTKRIDQSFIDSVCYILESDKSVVWVMVGVARTSEFLSFDNRIERLYASGRIIVLGFIDYLGDLLNHAVLFLYPRQKGGAGGIALAAMRGIPVLTFVGGDADSVLAPEDLCISYDQFQERSMVFLGSEKLRADWAKRYEGKFTTDLYLREAQRLLDACAEAREIFQQRHQNSAITHLDNGAAS